MDAERTPDGTRGPLAAGAEDDETRQRHEARVRVEKKRAWTSAMLAYVVVNAGLTVMWAVTGRGYFWPGWVIGGWGVGMILGYWDTFVRRPISSADVDEELRRR